MMLLCFFISGIVFIRSFNAICYPVLYCEDGTIMFAYYVNNPSLTGIFKFYNDYISLLPNIIGYLSTRFPPVIAPYVMTGCSLLITSLTFALFALKRFRFIIPSDVFRISVCILLALMTIGNSPIQTSATYSLWNLLYIYLLLSIAPVPPKPGMWLMQFVFISLAAWSHPWSIVALPVYAVTFFYRKTMRDRVMSISQAAILISYFAYGIKSVPATFNIGFHSIRTIVMYISHRVIFDSMFGGMVRAGLFQKGYPTFINVTTVIILLCFGILLFRLRTCIPEDGIRSILFFSILIVVLTGLNIVARGITDDMLTSHMLQRYFFIQQMVFLLIVSTILFYAVNRFKSGYFKRVIGIWVIAGVFFQNVYNRAVFSTSREEGRRTLLFLDSLHSGTNLDRYFDPERNQYVLTREGFDGLWNIGIDVDKVKASHVLRHRSEQTSPGTPAGSDME